MRDPLTAGAARALLLLAGAGTRPRLLPSPPPQVVMGRPSAPTLRTAAAAGVGTDDDDDIGSCPLLASPSLPVLAAESAQASST